MASTDVIAAPERTAATPSRRLIAAGVKRGTGPLVVEAMSPNDVLAHEKASHVRRAAVVEQPVLPPLPAQPAARRRAITLRGW